MGSATLSTLLTFADGTPTHLGRAANPAPSTHSFDDMGVDEAMGKQYIDYL